MSWQRPVSANLEAGRWAGSRIPTRLLPLGLHPGIIGYDLTVNHLLAAHHPVASCGVVTSISAPAPQNTRLHAVSAAQSLEKTERLRGGVSLPRRIWSLEYGVLGRDSPWPHGSFAALPQMTFQGLANPHAATRGVARHGRAQPARVPTRQFGSVTYWQLVCGTGYKLLVAPSFPMSLPLNNDLHFLTTASQKKLS